MYGFMRIVIVDYFLDGLVSIESMK